MVNKFKPISVSLSPNVQKDDVALALNLLFRPWKWRQGSAVKELEDNFKKYLGVKYAVSFNSGRSSLYAILKALDLPKGSDVALQAFTCNAVPNPILWAGLNPVYIDCADDFNIDIEDLKKKINYSLIRALGPQGLPKADKRIVLVVQHTFGLPAGMDKINHTTHSTNSQTGVCQYVIEDCAHALGAESVGEPVGVGHLQSLQNIKQKVGTFGDAAFFSFSRDKVISSVYGGMAVTNDDEIGAKLGELQKQFSQPSFFWIKQQLLHPILLYIMVLPLYKFFDLGKIFLVLSQWTHVLSKAVSWKEKRGLKPNYFPKALPNALAAMALNQFHKLETFNAHRKKIAEFYYQELAGTQFVLPKKENNIFLRFAIQHPKAHEIIYDAWHKENILLGDWYTTPIAPDDTQLKTVKYKLSMCPNAERLAKQTLNLPTHINIFPEDAKKIVNFLLTWHSSHS